MFKSLKIEAWRIRESILKFTVLIRLQNCSVFTTILLRTRIRPDPIYFAGSCCARIRTDYTVVSLPACLEFSGLAGQGLEHGLVVISLVLDTEGG